MPTEAARVSNVVPPEPWRSFLRDLDIQLRDVVVLRCLGGVVVTQQYGIGRGTSDIDYLSVSAISADDDLESLGGLGSALHKKWHPRAISIRKLSEARYFEEVRPYLLNKLEWHDQTLDLWIAMIEERS